MFINDVNRVNKLDDAVSGGEVILGHEFYQDNLALTHTEFENMLNGKNLFNISKENLNVEFLKSVLEDFEDYFLSVEYLLGKSSEEFKLNFLKKKFQNIITVFNTLFGENFEITAYQDMPQMIVELKLELLKLDFDEINKSLSAIDSSELSDDEYDVFTLLNEYLSIRIEFEKLTKEFDQKLILLELNQNLTKDLLSDISNFTPETLDYSKIERLKICLQTENSIKSDLEGVSGDLKRIKSSFDSDLVRSFYASRTDYKWINEDMLGYYLYMENEIDEKLKTRLPILKFKSPFIVEFKNCLELGKTVEASELLSKLLLNNFLDNQLNRLSFVEFLGLPTLVEGNLDSDRFWMYQNLSKSEAINRFLESDLAFDLINSISLFVKTSKKFNLEIFRKPLGDDIIIRSFYDKLNANKAMLSYIPTSVNFQILNTKFKLRDYISVFDLFKSEDVEFLSDKNAESSFEIDDEFTSVSPHLESLNNPFNGLDQLSLEEQFLNDFKSLSAFFKAFSDIDIASISSKEDYLKYMEKCAFNLAKIFDENPTLIRSFNTIEKNLRRFYSANKDNVALHDIIKNYLIPNFNLNFVGSSDPKLLCILYEPLVKFFNLQFKVRSNLSAKNSFEFFIKFMYLYVKVVMKPKLSSLLKLKRFDQSSIYNYLLTHFQSQFDKKLETDTRINQIKETTKSLVFEEFKKYLDENSVDYEIDKLEDLKPVKFFDGDFNVHPDDKYSYDSSYIDENYLNEVIAIISDKLSFSDLVNLRRTIKERIISKFKKPSD